MPDEKQTIKNPAEQQKGKGSADDKKDIEENKIWALVAYIIFFLPLLTEAKKSPFVKFHVKQSILLFITSVIVSLFGTYVPFVGWFIIMPLGSLFVLILWIMGIINTINGEKKNLPVIGKYAEQWFKF